MSPITGNVLVTENSNARISEFSPWGVFIRAWGWGVDTGAAEPQVCTTANGCLAGISGTGEGQLSSSPQGVAVDSEGDVYVVDRANLRVQKFDSTGNFELMLGGGVNKTKVEAAAPVAERNVCPIDPGDVCRGGAEGSGPGEFDGLSVGTYIAISPDGSLLVGDKGRIQEFEPDGAYKGEIELPKEKSPKSIAVDPASGAIYLTFSQDTTKGAPEEPWIYKHNALGWAQFAEVGRAEDKKFGEPVKGFPEALATDGRGDVFVAVMGTTPGRSLWREVLAFEPNGNCFLCSEEEELGLVEGPFAPLMTALATSSACNLGSSEPPYDLFVGSFVLGTSFVTAYGSPPDATVCPPPPAAPSISAQYAVSVGSDGATVKAKINPRFWPDTSYSVEYGTGECRVGVCATRVPVPPATLTGKTVNAAIDTTGVFLGGLEPETTYHFRFVSQSSGGGPVYGVDPDGEGPGEASPAEGLEGTFTTPPLVSAPPACPNDAFRIGAGAFLPDCRAYEMVSPVDKGNGDIVALLQSQSYRAALDQAAPSGDAFTYSSYRSFGSPKSAPYTSQYRAARDAASGWSSTPVSPPRGPFPILGQVYTLETEFRAFSEDLCEGWVVHDTDPLLAPGGIPGYANLYRASTCGPESYEALTTATVAPSLRAIEFVPEVQGVSSDGRKMVFRVQDRLLPEATGGKTFQLYEAEGGTLSLVNVLPGGAVCSADASAGSAASSGTHVRTESVLHAMSEDGSRVYWSCGATSFHKLYLRVAGEADSRAVLGSGEGRYWAFAADGSRAIYITSAGQLRSYDAAAGTSTTLAGQVEGVVAASKDASVVYAVSKAALGGGAQAGAHNLYLFEGGTATFIAALSAADARAETGGLTPSAINVESVKHAAAASPDGRFLAFSSSAPLTGFDNTDAQSGAADAEVFYYDADTGKLSCASCNPTGARPSGRETEPSTGYWTAAILKGTDTQLYQPRYLSADGAHLFFDSFEALVPRDTNSKRDVYEFEPASSRAQCEAGGGEIYSAAEGACISLISSGQSPADSEFLDAGANGRDAFFVTGSSLVPQDPGLIDVYDAREGGGFPPPPTPSAECEGQACQNPASPPEDPTPASSNLTGEGNFKPTSRSRVCGKGKSRVKARGGRVICKKKSHSKYKKHKRRHAVKRQGAGR